MSCPFCNYQGQVLDQDQSYILIRDLYPRAPYHYLLIPKDHISDFSDPQDLKAVVSKALTYDLPDKKIIVNFGSFIQVPHAHLHIMSDTPFVPIV